MRARPRRRRFLLRKRLLLLGLPLVTFAGLVALAPNSPAPQQSGPTISFDNLGAAGGTFRYRPDDEVYAFDIDPRKVRFGILEGWDREQDAYQDTAALAYVTGPMYERHIETSGKEVTVPLGDLKFGPRIWKGRNRTAARQRAYIGIKHDGSVDFGYGELTDARAKTYDTFIGGLHSIFNDLKEPPASYTGAYSISMGQRIRYYLPRIRMVFGLRQDGRLEMLMSKEGLTLEQTRELARRRGFVSAYLPDHASKSRLIIPQVKGFTEEDANWISGGATSFVHVPYLLRLSERRSALQGSLMSNLALKLRLDQQCATPVDCSQWFVGQLLDRSLAGLNRVMEKGVEPLARLIWPPRPSQPDSKAGGPLEQNRTTGSKRSQLPDPPITADPLLLRERQLLLPPADSSTLDDAKDSSAELLKRPSLPPDLPPPILMPYPTAPPSVEPEQQSFYDAPPPPVLPPPAP